MRLLKKTKLRRRIILSMAFAMILPIAISSWISMNDFKQRMVSQHHAYQEALLQVTMNGIMLFMDQHHPEEIHNSLSGLHAHTNLKSIQILSDSGKIKFSSIKAEQGTRLPDSIWKIGSRILETEKTYEKVDFAHQTMTLITRIPKYDRCKACHSGEEPHVGYLSIVDDISSINKELNIYARNTLLLATGIIVAIIITIFATHLRFVQRNLNHMSRAIAGVEAGNFKSHIPFDDNEEIGSLARSFNGMIDRLNVMRQELRVAHMKELERAEKLASVGQLAASMAHEIKNPVAGISSAMQVLIEDPQQDAQNVPIFEEISRQIQRVDHAVNSLLCFSRPREPRMVYTPVSTLIEYSLKLVHQHAKLANVNVDLQLDENVPDLFADPEQIEQVLVNLSMNGIQAMPEGGTLSIKVQYVAENDQVIIAVTDTGIGIEPDKLTEIFKPFYTSKHKGTGLGLAICKGIITRHCGEMQVDSVPGKGTTFTLILPRTPMVAQSESLSA